MIEAGRRPFLVALLACVLNGALAVTLFPASLQFTKYPRAAAQALAHALPPERLLDFSPFYLYLHVVQARWLPADAIVWLQVLATGAAAAFALLLLARFFPPWVALAGTAAFVLTRSVTVYSAVLEPEAFLLLFLLAFLHFALGARTRDRVLAGLALALALSIRPSVLPLLALVPLHFLLREAPRRWLKPSLIVVAPSLVVLCALAGRNAAAGEGWSPLGMNPGFVFFEGNNPLSSGRSAVYPPLVGELQYESAEPDSPHLAYRLVAMRSVGRELTTAEVNRYWRGKALNFIADHPAGFVERVGTKAVAAFHRYRAHDLVTAERYDEQLSRTRIPAFPFSVLAALALVGLVLSATEWRRLLLIYGLFFVQVLVMLSMYVSERQRLALLPSLVFFASATIAHLHASTGRRRAAWTAICLALALALALPTDRMREDRHLWAAYGIRDEAWSRSVRLRDEGDLSGSARAATLGYVAAPWVHDYARPAGVPFAPEGFEARAATASGTDGGNPSVWLDRAQLLLAAHRLDEADSLLRQIEADGARFDRGFVGSSQPLYYQARAAVLRAQPGRAIELLRDALTETPGDPFVLAELAALTGDDVHRQQIGRYFSPLDAAVLVGIAGVERGAGGAAAELSKAVLIVPELRRARLYLSAWLGSRGDTTRATELFLGAITERQDPVLLEERMLPLFGSAARSAPRDPEAQFRHGLVLRYYGHYPEALAVLREAHGLSPRADISQAIQEVEAALGRMGVLPGPG